MVRRLVQNQEVDFLVHQHTQPQAGLLAAGQVAHCLEHVFPLKQERAETVSRHLRRAVFLIEHGVVEAPLRVVKVDDLGQISPFHRGAELDFPLTVLLTQQALDKGGFSGAVVPQQGNALAALYQQIHVGEQRPVAEGFRHVLHLEHHVSGEIPLPEAGLHRSLRFGAFRLADAIHPVLDGHGPAVEGAVVDAPALHPLHRVAQLLQLRLFLLVLLHLQVKPRLLFVHVERVVAGVEFRVAVRDLDHPLGDLIDEITVVGNGKHRPPEILNIPFQPLHASQIQMVGRLVQKQDVRLFQQKAGEIRSGLFAAGKAVEFLSALFRRDAQAVADLVHVHIHFIAAPGLEAVGQAVVLPQLLRRCAPRHVRFQPLHSGFQLHEAGVGGAQHVLHGVARRELGDLGNQPQTLVRIDVDLAAVIVHLAGKDVEKCGFSAAVSAKDRHPLPFLNFKAQVVQQIFSNYKEFCQIPDLYINHILSI